MSSHNKNVAIQKDCLMKTQRVEDLTSWTMSSLRPTRVDNAGGAWKSLDRASDQNMSARSATLGYTLVVSHHSMATELLLFCNTDVDIFT